MKLKTTEILIGGITISLGIIALTLGLRNSRLQGEIKILQNNLVELNKRCDDKDRYIGKILTEIKINK